MAGTRLCLWSPVSLAGSVVNLLGNVAHIWGNGGEALVQPRVPYCNRDLETLLLRAKGPLPGSSQPFPGQLDSNRHRRLLHLIFTCDEGSGDQVCVVKLGKILNTDLRGQTDCEVP